MLDGFESTSSFSALPLQRATRGGMEPSSGPLERAYFMSGPIERGALSGPLDASGVVDSNGNSGVPFSAPLGGMYVNKRKKKVISGIRKALCRNFSVVPVRNFVNGGGSQRKDFLVEDNSFREAAEMDSESNVQRALGKAGEDRVLVVVSEELGCLFVGIYDGFNGPDGPEFLMSHLYKSMYNELEGFFWENDDVVSFGNADTTENPKVKTDNLQDIKESKECETYLPVENSILEGEQVAVKRRRLWEFLVEDDVEDGLDLSGSDRFAFSVDDAFCMNNAGSEMSRSAFTSKQKHGLLNSHKDKESKRLFPWRFWLEVKVKAAVRENDKLVVRRFRERE